MDSITPLTGISSVGTATSDGAGKNTGRPFSAGKGEIFKAQVAEARGNNIFLLDINGTKIPVESKVRLTIGEQLTLQITESSPTIQLKIVSDSQNIFQGRPLTLLGNAIDVKGLIQLARNTFQSPLQSLSAKTADTVSTFISHTPENLLGKNAGHMLKQMVDRLGISFETLLHQGKSNEAQMTLKAALLEMTTTFQHADDLAEKTHSLLTTIELYQLAQLSLDKDGLLIFPLPLSFLQKGYLSIEKDQKGNIEDSVTKEVRFSLNLCLEGLGNLKIECIKYGEGLYLRFFAENDEKAAFIQKQTETQLENALSTLILGMQWSTSQNEPSGELIKKVLGKTNTLVNTKI